MHVDIFVPLKMHEGQNACLALPSSIACVASLLEDFKQCLRFSNLQIRFGQPMSSRLSECTLRRAVHNAWAHLFSSRGYLQPQLPGFSC